MTASRAVEVAKRAPGRAKATTMAGALAAIARAAADAKQVKDNRPEWSRYAKDPVGFARDVLGIELLPVQKQIVESVRDNSRTAVRSGRKIGKSMTCAVVALWYYCSFPGARVFLTAVTDRQVNKIMWREIMMILRNAPGSIPGADGVLSKNARTARTGMRKDDFAEISGFTATDREAMAGLSGAHQLYVIDEASGVTDDIFDAIEGNRAAGGARMIMISNPTKTSGEFFNAFHEKAQFYSTFHVSSRDVTQYRLPGLADAGWIGEKELEYGEGSSFVRAHIDGEFPTDEDKKAIPLALIEAAQSRWDETKPIGRLYVGLDPAGPGLEGDETAFAVRRGLKIMRVVAFRGLRPESILVNLLGLLQEYANVGAGPRHLPPVVMLDKQGEVGGRVLGVLRAHAAQFPQAFELHTIQSSNAALRFPDKYARLRDELWANLRDWMLVGGAIPQDDRLASDLHAIDFETIDARGSFRLKATSKKVLHKALGRSPDRGDAVTLACWEPLSARAQEVAPPEHGGWAPEASNPYDALRVWQDQ